MLAIRHQVLEIGYMKNKLLFLILFTIIGIIALQIPVNALAGAKVKFTLFDLFAPISGAFLGSAVGAVAVVVMQAFNLAVHGFAGVQSDSILKFAATLRFLPLIMGVLYFSFASKPFKGVSLKGSRLLLLVPLLSIIAFVMHPIGRSVWFYSLFWLIPLMVWPVRQRFLLARALGSTFTAHAVGGAVWIWAFNLPAAVWVSLIPIVALERSIFALGIAASYILVNNLILVLSAKVLFFRTVKLDKKYLLFKKQATNYKS